MYKECYRIEDNIWQGGEWQSRRQTDVLRDSTVIQACDNIRHDMNQHNGKELEEEQMRHILVREVSYFAKNTEFGINNLYFNPNVLLLI